MRVSYARQLKHANPSPDPTKKSSWSSNVVEDEPIVLQYFQDLFPNISEESSKYLKTCLKRSQKVQHGAGKLKRVL